MQLAIDIDFTQSVKSRFLLTIFGIEQYQQWLIKEYFFGLGPIVRRADE